MTKDAFAISGNTSLARANLCNFLMFLTGALLGCWFASLGDACLSFARFFSSGGSDPFSRMLPAMVFSGKFLLLLLLMSRMRSGALLIPLVFALEGMLLGNGFAAAFIFRGYQGIILLGILSLFRLCLILPFGFLMGAWAVSRSLDPSEHDSNGAVLILTLCILFVSAFLEGTVAFHLCSNYYYFQVGV